MKKIVLLFLVLCCEATGYSMDIESTMPSDTLYVASADIDDVATTDTAVSETPKKRAKLPLFFDIHKKMQKNILPDSCGAFLYKITFCAKISKNT